MSSAIELSVVDPGQHPGPYPGPQPGPHPGPYPHHDRRPQSHPHLDPHPHTDPRPELNLGHRCAVRLGLGLGLGLTWAIAVLCACMNEDACNPHLQLTIEGNMMIITLTLALPSDSLQMHIA